MSDRSYIGLSGCTDGELVAITLRLSRKGQDIPDLLAVEMAKRLERYVQVLENFKDKIDDMRAG